MIKCRQALEDGVCEKDICCAECPDSDACVMVCEFSRDERDVKNCEYAITEENALALMKQEGAEVIKAITDFNVQKKQMEEQEKTMRKKLQEVMEKYGVKKFENDSVAFTYIAPTTRRTLDTTRLKKEKPELAEEYMKTSNVSASVKITVK